MASTVLYLSTVLSSPSIANQEAERKATSVSIVEQLDAHIQSTMESTLHHAHAQISQDFHCQFYKESLGTRLAEMHMGL